MIFFMKKKIIEVLNSRSDFYEMYGHINTHDTQQDDVFFPFTHLVVVVCDKSNTHPPFPPPETTPRPLKKILPPDRQNVFPRHGHFCDWGELAATCGFSRDPADLAHMLLISA